MGSSKPVLPYKWYKPFAYQREVFKAYSSGIKRFFLLWHRRSGKDLTSLCFMTACAHERVGEYYYVLPELTQSVKVLWNGKDTQGRLLREYIKEETIERVSNQEKAIYFKNGSVLRLIGAKRDSDKLRGTNPVGVVFSEAAYMKAEVWRTLLPVFAANDGWMMFQSTPCGKNDFYDMYNAVKDDENWFVSVKTIEDTLNHKGTRILKEADLVRDRKAMGMDKFKEASEYYCRFDHAFAGSYYEDVIKLAEEEGRIGYFPPIDGELTYAFYDLGVSDSTSIWFMQYHGSKKVFIDFYEDNGKALEFYVQELKRKGYKYAGHFLPHDGSNKSIQTNVSTVGLYRELCYKYNLCDYVKVAPRLPIQTGINNVREQFKNYHFHTSLCSDGLESLRLYKRKYDRFKAHFLHMPVHDAHSHAADALRIAAVLDSANMLTYSDNRIYQQPTTFESYNIWS